MVEHLMITRKKIRMPTPKKTNQIRKWIMMEYGKIEEASGSI